MAKYHLTLVLFPLLTLVVGQKAGWTCGDDGYYYEDGKKSTYTCDKSKDKSTDKSGGAGSKSVSGDDKSDGGNHGWTCVNGFWNDPQGAASTHPCKDGDNLKDSKGAGCNVTTMTGSAMTGLDRTCIAHPSYVDGRCWWTHVPDAIAAATDGRKVPLIVDMHGGGGCASHEMQSSGFKALADSNALAGGGMIVVWPQGGEGKLWASAGTSTRSSNSGKGGKGLPQWDDISFLEQMIANIVKSSTYKDKIDPERIYLSGFSLGCMMSHRFALERSKIVAAFGCHGGELSYYPTTKAEMDADKSTYDIQPMPAYITIGDADVWFPGANASWYAWKYWNGCTASSENSLTSELVEHVASSCTAYTPVLQTVKLVIKGGGHAPDTRAYEKAYKFMSQFKRAGALAELPAALPIPKTTTSGSDTSTSTSQTNVLFAVLSLLIIGPVASS